MQRTVAVAAMVVAAAGLIAVIVFAVTQMGKPQVAETPALPARAEPDQASEKAATYGIEVTGTEVVRRDREGNVIWRVSAEGTLEFDEEQRAARAEDVNWVLEESGLGKRALTAPLMEADYESKRLLFSEGVAIESEKEDASFSAERIAYEFDTEKLVGSGSVTVKRGKFTGTARELVIDSRARKVRLKGGGRLTHTGVKIPG